LFLIDAVIELSKVKPPATLQSYFNIISYQFTWRVRYELISKIERLAQAMGKDNFKSFLGYYIKYLNDIEPEIRSIANSKLEELIPFLDVEDIVGRVLPALKTIPQDTQPYVRSTFTIMQTPWRGRCCTSVR
jgi:serine/threonine-protein phosphatase 2A regulatory subunit A